MNLFVVVLQEVIEQLKKEIGVQETVYTIKMIIKQSGLDIRITSNGVITSDKNITNEDNYLHVFNYLRDYLNKDNTVINTKEIFKEASKQVVKIV